jgi:hypothetical protein
MEARETVGYAKGTVKNWKVTKGHLKKFLNDHCRIRDIAFHQLDLSFIVDFERFAKY